MLLLDIIVLSALSCAKNGWTDRFGILVVDWSGPKDAQVQSYSPGGANLPDDNLPWHVHCNNGWTDRFAVCVVDSARPKEAQVQSYSPGCANVQSWEDTLPPPGEYDWTIRLQRRCALCHITLITCYLWTRPRIDSRTHSRSLRAEYCIVGIPHNTAI